MKAYSRSLGLLAALIVSAVPLPAQQGVGEHINLDMARYWYVVGKVTTLQGDPVPGAQVKILVTNLVGQFDILKTTLQGEFRTEFQPLERVSELMLDVTATKPGFLKAHQIVDLASSDKTEGIAITLRDAKEDPSLISQADLLSSLVPRLKRLGPSDGLSASQEKDYARGVAEFLTQKDPDRALPSFIKVAHHDSSCVGCRTMLGLAELDSGDWDGANRDLNEAVKQSQANRAAGRPEPMLALGVMESWQHEPKQAAGYFLEALKLAPQDRLALQELGRTQLAIENWAAASEYFAKALDAGAGPEARLMRVEALLGEGKSEEANQEITRYLAGREVKKMPPRVRQLWAQVQDRGKQAAYQKAREEVASVVNRPLNELVRAMPELNGLEPATGQGPLDSVLSAVGKNVAAFFRNFPNTTSVEQIHEEQVRRNGKPGQSLDQKCHYLLVAHPDSGGLALEEFRGDSRGNPIRPAGRDDGFMITSGFANLAILFHPDYQRESAFRYLGEQTIDDHKTVVVAFAQRPKVARITERFKTDKESTVILFQGVAWIDSSSSQIIRLRTDLLRPQPTVRLEKQTTEIHFGEVRFKEKQQAFWLPREVMVTLQWGGKTLRNQHDYSDFRLYSVGAEEKRKPVIGALLEPTSSSDGSAGPPATSPPQP